VLVSKKYAYLIYGTVIVQSSSKFYLHKNGNVHNAADINMSKRTLSATA
jgi:hypothetical protein